MIAKKHIITIVLISICAVLAVTFGCVFGLNNASPKTDLNTSVNASTYTSGNYVYTYTSGSGTCTIKANSSSKPTGAITLPSSVTISGATYTVTGITNSGFSSCTGITKVTIPSTITTIGNSAFQSCTGLTGTLTIPNSVTSIESWAFSYCSKLTSITIPDGVTSIGNYAFYGCSGLTGTLTIPNSVTSIGSSAFNDCGGTGIYVESSNPNYCSVDGVLYNKAQTQTIACLRGKTGSIAIPNSVTSIGNSMFYSCSGLTSVTIGTGVTSIGSFAFYGCSGLTGTLAIPSSVTSIGSSAFSGCSGLSSITIGSGVASIGDSAFYNCTGLTEINYNAINVANFTTTSGVFSNAGKDGDGIVLNIGAEVKHIPAYFGYYYSKNSTTGDTYTYYCYIKQINFATNSACESIGDYAFYYCDKNYTGSLILPEGLTTIGAYAFYNFNTLTSLTIPSSVTSIGDYAFNYMAHLKVLNYNAKAVSDFGGLSHVFANMGITNKDLIINIGPEVTYIPAYFGYSRYSSTSSIYDYIYPKEINFLSNNTNFSIGAYAFYKCTTLVDTINLMNCTSIGNYAFYECTTLVDTLNLLNCTSIGNYAFAGCTGLTGALKIGSNVSSIATYAFNGCSGITSIYFLQPNNFTVGSSAFTGGNSSVKYYFYSQDVLDNTKTTYGTTSYFTNTNFLLCYTITFNSNGGNYCEDLVVNGGGNPYGTLPTPTLDGYAFGGWYRNSGLSGGAVTNEVVVIESHTLYAKWVLSGININVSGTSSSLSSSIMDLENMNATILARPQSGHYVSQFSFDNSTFYTITNCTTTIDNSNIALNVKCFANVNTNVIQLVLNGIFVDINTSPITIYLKTTTTPYTELKSNSGGSISGVAVTSTIGGMAYIVGDNYDSLDDSDTITFSTKLCVSGYAFSHWEDLEGNNLGSAMSIRLPKSQVMDNIITAVYVQNTNDTNDDLNNV